MICRLLSYYVGILQHYKQIAVNGNLKEKLLWARKSWKNYKILFFLFTVRVVYIYNL